MSSNWVTNGFWSYVISITEFGYLFFNCRYLKLANTKIEKLFKSVKLIGLTSNSMCYQCIILVENLVDTSGILSFMFSSFFIAITSR